MSHNRVPIERTSQEIDNWGFDETYNEPTVLPVEEHNGTLVRKQSDPTDGYKISDIDDSGYYGYIKADGSWYIMSLINNQARYVKGDSAYSTAWTNRASQSYDLFNVIFN